MYQPRRRAGGISSSSRSSSVAPCKSAKDNETASPRGIRSQLIARQKIRQEERAQKMKTRPELEPSDLEFEVSVKKTKSGGIDDEMDCLVSEWDDITLGSTPVFASGWSEFPHPMGDQQQLNLALRNKQKRVPYLASLTAFPFQPANPSESDSLSTGVDVSVGRVDAGKDSMVGSSAASVGSLPTREDLFDATIKSYAAEQFTNAHSLMPSYERYEEFCARLNDVPKEELEQFYPVEEQPTTKTIQNSISNQNGIPNQAPVQNQNPIVAFPKDEKDPNYQIHISISDLRRELRQRVLE